ncbi:MAG: AAA family ATPase [Bacteriovoracaceae bacterium]
MPLQTNIQDILNVGNQIILGKEREMKLALTAFIAHGHLLIEDVPGMGKTTFAKFMCRALGLSLSRIQFTSDLLPADILGVQIFHQSKAQFEFHPGPIFNQFILADELNRGTAKTQSALLEAMEEYQITVDKMTYPLPSPFFVIATQNPRSQIGTNPLPESQLDRFMMKIKLGYPEAKEERQLLLQDDRSQKINAITPVVKESDILKMINEAKTVHVSSAILDYVTTLLETSRQEERFQGLSPRAGIDLMKAAKAWAYIHGENKVLPEHIQEVAVPVISHRLSPFKNISIDLEMNLTKELINKIKVY